jgi:hypothetical protein
MSQSITFGKDGKCYGILFPMGARERPVWEMSFYATERGRKTGIAYLFKLLGDQCPMYKFELTLAEIVRRGVIVPFIPGDRAGKLERMVKPDWKPKKERPAWKDN